MSLEQILEIQVQIEHTKDVRVIWQTFSQNWFVLSIMK